MQASQACSEPVKAVRSKHILGLGQHSSHVLCAPCCDQNLHAEVGETSWSTRVSSNIAATYRHPVAAGTVCDHPHHTPDWHTYARKRLVSMSCRDDGLG